MKKCLPRGVRRCVTTEITAAKGTRVCITWGKGYSPIWTTEMFGPDEYGILDVLV